MKMKPYTSTLNFSIDFGKRAQVSTIDFIAGFLMVVTALLLASNLIFTLQEKSSFSSLQDVATAVSEDLMSEGYPADWNATSVIKLGLLSNNTLSPVKIQDLSSLSYDDIRASLGTPYDVYWYFHNASGVVNVSACGYGNPSVVVDALSCEPSFSASRNLVHLQRILVYNNSLITMEVVVWD